MRNKTVNQHRAGYRQRSAYYYRRTVDLTFEVIREYDDLWDEAQRQSQ